MKKKRSFLQSLEKYGWVVVGRSPLPYTWVGVGVVAIVLIVSVLNVKTSVVGLTSEREIIEKAARAGDYELAQRLFNVHKSQMTNPPAGRAGSQILGAESELEDQVYPEKKLQRETEKWEGLNVEYPSNREIMAGLAKLYAQAGRDAEATELREQIRILDPNGE